ncbi:FmdB family zinc ribbon protein [Zhaonella formicivorans]|uniref:FmdB family zinc ribbon protein n=1 Tax=Zhaonella formicivorans TaxID=2528593 RepID=UPI0010F3C8BE|nr:zinc ribbon domain-containing protein [Zhaonella formicivorans]
MPTYDYVCKDCGHRFSLFLRLSEKDRARCTKCSSSNVNQLFTGFLYSKPGGGSAGGCSGGNCSTCSGC